MVSSAIWEKRARVSFSKTIMQDCTSPKEECNLKSLKNSSSVCFFKLHEKTHYHLLIIYMKKFRVNYIFIFHSHRPSACVILSRTNKL